MIDIIKLMTINESSNKSVYTSMSLNESCLYHQIELMESEIEYRDIIDETANDIIQSYYNKINGIMLTEAAENQDKEKTVSWFTKIKNWVLGVLRKVISFFKSIGSKITSLFKKNKEKITNDFDKLKAKGKFSFDCHYAKGFVLIKTNIKDVLFDLLDDVQRYDSINNAIKVALDKNKTTIGNYASAAEDTEDEIEEINNKRLKLLINEPFKSNKTYSKYTEALADLMSSFEHKEVIIDIKSSRNPWECISKAIEDASGVSCGLKIDKNYINSLLDDIVGGIADYSINLEKIEKQCNAKFNETLSMLEKLDNANANVEMIKELNKAKVIVNKESRLMTESAAFGSKFINIAVRIANAYNDSFLNMTKAIIKIKQ